MNRIALFALALTAGATLALFWLTSPAPVPRPADVQVAEQASQDLPRSERKRRLKRALRMDQPNGFQAFHHAIRTRRGETAPRYAHNYRVAELTKARRLRKGAVVPLPWQERGPGNVSGRTRAIVPDVGDPSLDTWFVASVGGGIWKTTDAGATWRELTAAWPNLGTATLVQTPSNPDVLYAGTGEGFNNFAAVFGAGIFKSTDRGETWTQLASTADNPAFTTVTRLLVDPHDADHVLASTWEGNRLGTPLTNTYLFRSTDGGATWQQVYQGAVEHNYLGRADQLVATPGNFDVLYATLNGTGVLKSTDGGQTWALASDGLAPHLGGRLEMAIAPNDPNRLYLSAEDQRAKSIFYLSTDAGATWKLGVPTQPELMDWLGGQGWYDNAIAVHPFDPNRVFLGGVYLMEAQLGTATGTTVEIALSYVANVYSSIPAESKGVHPDQHHLLPVVRDAAQQQYRLLVANDGGVAFSDDDGDTFLQTGGWRTLAGGLQGLNTAQFYGVDKMNGADRYLGGTQDNGTWYSDADPDAASTWTYAPSGDGMEVTWHYYDPDWMIETVQNGVYLRTKDGGANWASLDTPDLGLSTFLTRVAKSNQNPNLLFGVVDGGVIRSDDFGDSWTEVAMPDPCWHLSLTMAVRISLADPANVWAGAASSDTCPLFVSTDAGLSFQKATPFPVATLGPMTNVATHPSDPNTAYALFSQAGLPKILKTKNLGQTWTDISGYGNGSASTNGFPDVAVYDLLVMPHDPDHLWAGTEIGLFVSENGGASWQYADNGLPAVSIWQLRVVNDEVVVATHGRGVWTVALPELSGYEPPMAVVPPFLANATGGLGGEVTLTFDRNSAYDSLVVYADGGRLRNLGPNTTRGRAAFNVNLAVSAPHAAVFSAKAYLSGTVFNTRTLTLTVVPEGEVLETFATDFDAGVPDAFDLQGFEVGFPRPVLSAFPTSSLNTEHPYPDDTEAIAALRTPVLVAQQQALIQYDEIVIVEPGEAGSTFGEAAFRDYVVVEGSRDGGTTWLPVAPGYDAREDAEWLALHDNVGLPTPQHLRPRTLDLHATFNPGELVYLRFRFFADITGNNWGWLIDNLMIQPGATDTEAEADLPTTFALEQNYPNPFNPTTTIQYRLGETAAVTLTIFDVSGRRVRTLLSGQVQGAGDHRVLWDGRSDGGVSVASGTYLYRLEAGDRFVQTRRMVLVK